MCFVFTDEHSLIHTVRVKKIYHFIMITERNPTFQSSLVKPVFCYQKTLSLCEFISKAKKKTLHFALVGYSETIQL